MLNETCQNQRLYGNPEVKILLLSTSSWFTVQCSKTQPICSCFLQLIQNLWHGWQRWHASNNLRECSKPFKINMAKMHVLTDVSNCGKSFGWKSGNKEGQTRVFFSFEFIHFHRIGKPKTFLVHNLSIVLLQIPFVLKQNNYLQKIAG